MNSFLNVLEILIEKEEEEKNKARDNWTVSEYSYHDGKLNAYRDCYQELKKHYANLLDTFANI